RPASLAQHVRRSLRPRVTRRDRMGAPMSREITRIAAHEVIARIEAELAAMRTSGDDPRTSLLATDADGTLWSGDIGIDLFEALLASHGVRDDAREALAAEARAHGIDDTGDANAIASRLYDAFKAERYPDREAFAMMTWAFAGRTVEE